MAHTEVALLHILGEDVDLSPLTESASKMKVEVSYQSKDDEEDQGESPPLAQPLPS